MRGTRGKRHERGTSLNASLRRGASICYKKEMESALVLPKS